MGYGSRASTTSGSTRVFQFLAGGIALYAAFLFIRFALSTVFLHHDDEGYVLLSLKHYIDGDHLYTQTFTQYGPFYYLLEGGLFRLFHLPVTHDWGRLFTGIFWLLTSAIAAYFVFRISKSSVMSCAAGVATTFLGHVLVAEPSHPQQLIFPILMLSCCASLIWAPTGMVLLGVCGAVLFFTKINVGVFSLAATFLAFVCVLPNGRLRKAGVVLGGAYAAAIPFLLMHQDIVRWAAAYCFIATLCGLSTFIFGLLCGPRESSTKRMMVYCAAGGVATGCLIVIACLFQNVTPGILLHGVLLDPMKRNGALEHAASFTVADVALGLAITLGLVWLFRLRSNTGIYTNLVGTLRCIAGLCAIVLLSAGWDTSPVTHPLVIAALPLVLLPPGDEPWRLLDYFPRLFVTILSAAQFLQPYPVAGSQCAISEASLLLWAFLCLHDGAAGVSELVEKRTGGFVGSLTMQSVLGTLMFFWLTAAMLGEGIWRARLFYPASTLRGAHHLHLPMYQEGVYVPVADNISANCDVLFSLPGMGSFNFWSGVPTPNGFNLTHWPTVFTPEEQDRILLIIQKDPQACVLYNASMVSWWLIPRSVVERSSLGSYIIHDMPVAYEKRDYQIRVNPNRREPWIRADGPALDTSKSH